jgi:predicted DNA-binding transcriptional regulator AlpA
MALLNVEEVAAILRMSRNTVSNGAWRKRHGLKFFHIGKRIVFEEADVWAFIEAKKEESQELEKNDWLDESAPSQAHPGV